MTAAVASGRGLGRCRAMALEQAIEYALNTANSDGERDSS